MCDKLQTSKDGNVDLFHSRSAEYNSSHGVQQYYYNSSVSNRKQRKYGKGKTHRADPNVPHSSGGFRSHQEKLFYGGNSPNQSSPKQGQKKYREPSVRGSVDSLTPKKRGGSETGRKKAPTSLNHLLNFTVASSERCGGMPPIRHRRRDSSHSYNKEEFLQANCQFVVSASGDYSIHLGDPDKLVEWDCIEQVRLFCQEIPSCPICLYPPKAAKITRCGHVYCWSCLLHYLSLGDKKWSRCPICNESIYRKDIKSVAALSTSKYEIGDTISMKLMVREKGTTKVWTRADWYDQNFGHGMLTIEDSCVNQFVKLVSATPLQVLSFVTGPERKDLEAQLTSLLEEEAPERCFVESALQDLEVRESGLNQVQCAQSEAEKMAAELSLSWDVASPEAESKPVSMTWTSFSDDYFEEGFEYPFSDPEDSTDSIQSVGDSSGEAAQDRPSSGQSSGDASPNSESSPQGFYSDVGTDDPLPTRTKKGHLVYFYQASDGQHFYLHPINVKCLSKEYGGLEHCPDEVTAVVVEVEQLTMSEEVRGRYKSLSHLPLTCEVVLCELELKPPVLSQATLEYYSTEICRRKQKRVKKKKDERRREKRAEAKNSMSEPAFQVPSAMELTPEKFHDFLSLASSPSLSDSGSPKVTFQSMRPTSVEGGDTSSVGSPPAPSFAQALQGGVKTSPRDSQDQQADINTSSFVGRVQDELSVPSLQEAFNEAFQTASESVWAAHKAPGGKPGSRTAKKGRKKLVLFSTGGSRGAI